MRCLKTLALFVAFLGLAGSAVAFNPQPDPPGFGMIGVVRGQTARLNVVMPIPEFRPGDTRALGPSPHMNVLLQFVDDMGNVLGDGSVRLTPGRAAHLDYVASDVFGARKQIRAVVRFVERDGPDKKTGVLATLEVFDTESGRTAFVLPGTESCFKEVDPAPASDR